MNSAHVTACPAPEMPVDATAVAPPTMKSRFLGVDGAEQRQLAQDRVAASHPVGVIDSAPVQPGTAMLEGMETTAVRGWRRLIRWPVFCALGALHILVLPLLFAERSDQRLALAAGTVYLLLAIADRRSADRPA